MDDEKIDIYSQIRRDFIKNYKRKAAPFFEVYEKKRKASIIRFFILSVLLTPVISFLLMSVNACISGVSWSDFTGGFFENDDAVYQSFFLILILLIPLLFFLSMFIWKKINEIQLKKAVMPHVCKCFGDINLKWRSGANMTRFEKADVGELIKGARPDFLNNSRIYTYTAEDALNVCFSSYSDIVYDDIFEGRYGGVKFDIYEITVYRIKPATQRHPQITFRGVIVKFDMNKIFKGTTVIAPRGSKISGLKRTVLEDIEFEKKFDVYTDDEVEARYLITTAFMERLKYIGVAFSSYKQRCSFYQNSLILALESNRDLFSQGSLFKRADYYSQCMTMLDEVLSIVKLIDHFKLDTKIGL